MENAGDEFDEIGLEHVDLLKITAEGCEPEILEALGPRLAKVDCVLVAYHCVMHRRKIDELLEDFVLWEAKVDAFDVGLLKYVNKTCLQEHDIPFAEMPP